MKDVIVIYHGNCYDGVTAAWICEKVFGDNAEYIPLNYSDSPPDVKGKEVYIVDFSFKRDVILKMREEAKNLIVLDHHKTAEKELENIPGTVFDMNRSGAGITWDWFFPNNSRPYLVQYVEDRDLWRFQLLDSKKINAFIQSFDINLLTWINEVGPAFERLDFNTIKSQGETCLRIEEKYVKQICANARLKRINEYIAPYVETSILMSEVCHYLIHDHQEYKQYPFSFYSFKRKDGKIQYGMRSKGDFDVSIIAKNFGGGGHKNAAGFEVDKEL